MKTNMISMIYAQKYKKAVLSQGEPRDAAVKFRYVTNFTFKSIMECLCTLSKHRNLVGSDASGAKTSTKHLESRLEFIQGHTFWDH